MGTKRQGVQAWRLGVSPTWEQTVAEAQLYFMPEGDDAGDDAVDLAGDDAVDDAGDDAGYDAGYDAGGDAGDGVTQGDLGIGSMPICIYTSGFIASPPRSINLRVQ